MAQKKVIVWTKVRGILRDKIEDNMVIVWALPGGILRDKMADKKVIM